MMNHRYKPTARFEAAGRKILARRTTRDAILGDENGFVDVPNELGYHWARFAASADVNNNATFGPAFKVMANPGAGYSPTNGRRVKLKLTDEGWKVEEGSFQDMVQAGIDPRALNPNDPYRAFRYLDEITDTSSRGIASGLKVQVQGWKYNTADNVFKIDIGTDATTHVDLTSNRPSAGNHRYAVLVFNITEDIAGNDPWQVYDSTAIATTTALTEANIQTAYDLFPSDELIVPIKAYYLAAGQTTIKGPRYDVDLRTAWNIPGVIDGQVTLPKLADGTPGKVIGFDGSGSPAELTFPSGGMESFEVAGDSGTPFDIEDADTFTFEGAGGIEAITDDATKTIIIDGSGVTGITGYILLQDQKSSGTNGGTFTGGVNYTRDLNTIAADTTGSVSLASSQFTLPAGTYRIRAEAPTGLNVDAHQSWLYNVTDATTVMRGTSSVSVQASVIRGRFSIGGTKVFEIRHRCNDGPDITGFGHAAGLGTEIYTTVELEKE